MCIVKKRIKKIIIDNFLWRNVFITKHYYFVKEDIDNYIKEFHGERSDKRKMRRNLFKYGCIYDEYFLYGIKDLKNGANGFITEINSLNYYNLMNKRKNQIDFDDKSRTYDIFGMYYFRDLKKITSKEDFFVWCKFNTDFIFKPLDSSSGKGIRVIRREQSDVCIGDLWEELSFKIPFVVEELIEQSAIMASLHPSSVNTIRIPTILTGNSEADYEVHVFYPVLKIGQHGCSVDNAGAGGIVCLIDDNGVVCADGYDKNNNRYVEHPETHIILKGFKLPDWDKAVNMCKKAALSYTDNRYISFDLAHSEKYGWVMVEANARGQFTGTEMCDKKGKKRELDLLCSKIK